jgi:hypothetical protein
VSAGLRRIHALLLWRSGCIQTLCSVQILRWRLRRRRAAAQVPRQLRSRTTDITYFDRSGCGRNVGSSSGTMRTVFGGHGISKVSRTHTHVIVGAASVAFSMSSAGVCGFDRPQWPEHNSFSRSRDGDHR